MSRLTPKPEGKKESNILKMAGMALSTSRKATVPQKALPVSGDKGHGEEGLTLEGGYQGEDQRPHAHPFPEFLGLG